MVNLTSVTIGDVLTGSIFSGPKKLDRDAILPFIIVPLILFTSAISVHFTIALFSMTTMGVLYVLSRPRKKNRSPFFFSWTLSSILFMYLVYLDVIKLYTITVPENCVLVVLAACTCYLFYKMKSIADHELTGISKGKEYSPVLTADSQYCQICQIEVNERFFHSIWWDCCIFRANYRYFVWAHIFSFMTLLVGTNHSLTTACRCFMIYGIVLPYNCDYVYYLYRPALAFVTSIYALGYLLVVTLVLLHQLYGTIAKKCGKVWHNKVSHF